MQDFRKLTVWQKNHRLTLSVYRATARFPRDGLYGLTGQLRRACASIPTNAAEGSGRGGGTDFARFLQVAMGSASEAEYLLQLAGDLGLLPKPDCERLTSAAVEVKRMLTSLIHKVRTTPRRQPPTTDDR